MSSLLNTASPWVNGSTTSVAKKRTPTMKLPKLDESPSSTVENFDTDMSMYQPLQDNVSLYNNSNNNTNNVNNINSYGGGGSILPPKSYEMKNEKHEQINQILEKMNIENDGSGLQDYSNQPPPPPMWKMKLENTWKPPPPPTYIPISPEESTSTVYKYAYESPSNFAKGGGGTDNSFEENIMYKLQYLTHLTEQMGMDKTSNTTEEFILYIMVGIFMIYIVDSFTRIR